MAGAVNLGLGANKLHCEKCGREIQCGDVVIAGHCASCASEIVRQYRPPQSYGERMNALEAQLVILKNHIELQKDALRNQGMLINSLEAHGHYHYRDKHGDLKVGRYPNKNWGAIPAIGAGQPNKVDVVVDTGDDPTKDKYYYDSQDGWKKV